MISSSTMGGIDVTFQVDPLVDLEILEWIREVFNLVAIIIYIVKTFSS